MQTSLKDNKGSDSELTMISEIEQLLWQDTSWSFREESNQKMNNISRPSEVQLFEL